MEDEKRARTGPSDDSEDSGEKMMASHEHSSPLLSPLRTVCLGNPASLAGVPLNLPEPLKGLRGVGFAAPLTTDGLSGLVELIAPSLSDGGGSGSSGGSCGEVSAYPRMTSAHTAPSYAQQEPPHALPMNSAGNSGGGVSFLSVGSAPAQHGSGASVGAAVPPGEPPGAPPPSSILPSSAIAARAGLARQPSIRSTRRLTPSLSAPAPGLACLPPRGLPPRSSSSGTTQTGTGTGGGCFEGPPAKAAFFQEASAAVAAGGLRRWVEEEGLVADADGGQQQPAAAAEPAEAAAAAAAPPALPRRGALPMELEARPKAHLKTFMRTVGSLLLLAGTEALREATFEDSSEEEMPQARSPTAGPTAAGPAAAGPTAGSTVAGSGGGVGNGPFRAAGETKRFDPMEGAEDENEKTSGVGDSRKKHTPTAPGSAVGAAGGGGDGKGEAGVVVDVFAQACRAEAWAAVAIGVLFSGAGEEEGKLYASRAVDCLSGCLDAPLPEVHSCGVTNRVVLLLVIMLCT